MAAMVSKAMKKYLAGARVVDAGTMRGLAGIDRIEQQLRAECAATRARIAVRLRLFRERSRQRSRIQSLMAAGRAFAGDLEAWARWRLRLRDALDDAVRDIGEALPRPLLLEKQIRSAMAQVARATSPLRVHANERTRETVERVLAALPWKEGPVPYAVVVTHYLEDDTCVIETPRGLIEGRVALEIAAFCAGVRESLRDGAGAERAP